MSAATGTEEIGTDRAPKRLPARIGARLIDATVLAGVGLALGSVIGFGPGWLAIQAIGVFAYFVVLDVLSGTTLGKRLLGLRVVGADGRTPSFREAAIRETFTLAGAIPFVGPLLAAVAWVAILVTINDSTTGQGIHDRLAAGTRVVAA